MHVPKNHSPKLSSSVALADATTSTSESTHSFMDETPAHRRKVQEMLLERKKNYALERKESWRETCRSLKANKRASWRKLKAMKPGKQPLPKTNYTMPQRRQVNDFSSFFKRKVIRQQRRKRLASHRVHPAHFQVSSPCTSSTKPCAV